MKNEEYKKLSIDEFTKAAERYCQRQVNLTIPGQEKIANFSQKKKASTSDDFQ